MYGKCVEGRGHRLSGGGGGGALEVHSAYDNAFDPLRKVTFEVSIYLVAQFISQ